MAKSKNIKIMYISAVPDVEFLKPDTGFRRFWPIPVAKTDKSKNNDK